MLISCQIYLFNCFISFVKFLHQNSAKEGEIVGVPHGITTEIQLLAGDSDSGSRTGRSCPQRGGEEISPRFVCKRQERVTASSEQADTETSPVEPTIVRSHLESSSSERLPSSHHAL